MGLNFQELDHRQTPLGELNLRRRRILSLDNLEVYEVKLGDEFLMSSLFHVVEVALADLGLAAVNGDALDVVVGGLGLGYTARAALQNPRVGSLVVIDFLAAVIEWHEQGLVPLGPELTADSRCRFLHADFFAQVRSPDLDLANLGRKFHAVLLDIDHTPSHWLHPTHADLYQPAGLQKLSSHLHPGGVFAMWSDGQPDAAFMDSLRAVFVNVSSHIVEFANPLQHNLSSSTVYIAHRTA